MSDQDNAIEKRSNVEKLNEVLGIESIDDVLDSLSVEKNDEQFNITLAEIDDHVKQQMQTLDKQTDLYKNNPANFNVHTMESALNEVSGLIEVSKGIIQKVYEYVKTSDLLDPEVIGAGAKMIEAARLAVCDYVEMYKKQIDHFNKIQMEMIKQRHKLEAMDYKVKCDVDKARQLDDKKDEGEDINLMEYTQERIVQAMKEVRLKEKAEVVEAELIEEDDEIKK